MFEYLQTNTLLAPSFTDVVLFSLSMLVAELYNRLHFRAVLSIQRDLSRTRKNLVALADKLQKTHSQSVLCVGKNMFNLHHWRFGLFLIALSTFFVNVHLFFVSLGLIVHHILRKKSYSKLSS